MNALYFTHVESYIQFVEPAIAFGASMYLSCFLQWCLLHAYPNRFYDIVPQVSIDKLQDFSSIHTLFVSLDTCLLLLIFTVLVAM